ncbi:MAG: hypothetical protein M3Y87_01420 [Myxococcota bacterium]|nr:hypothetical protein [Myxococcota bacterium]
MTARTLAAILALSLLALPPGAARADEVACPEVGPDDAEVQRRLRWLEARFADTEDDVRRWFGAFIVLHGLLTGVQLTLALATPDDQSRIDFIVNTTGSGLGLVTLLLSTPPILGAGDLMRSLPRDTPEDRLASLRIAEARMRRSAEASGFVRSPLPSLATTFYVAAGGITLLLLDRPVGAILHAAGGTVLGQGRLLLHPTGAIDAWRTYLHHHADAGCTPEGASARYDAGMRFAISPSGVGTGGAGLALTLSF